METISALLALCEVNSLHKGPLVTGGYPSQRPVTRSFNVFFYARLDKRLCKQSICRWLQTPQPSLWCHCNAENQWNLDNAVTDLPPRWHMKMMHFPVYRQGDTWKWYIFRFIAKVTHGNDTFSGLSPRGHMKMIHFPVYRQGDTWKWYIFRFIAKVTHGNDTFSGLSPRWHMKMIHFPVYRQGDTWKWYIFRFIAKVTHENDTFSGLSPRWHMKMIHFPVYCVSMLRSHQSDGSLTDD